MSIIRDAALEPYYIGKDAYCYTVYEEITPKKENLEKGKKGVKYEKPVGHYNNLGSALLKISKSKLDSNPEDYNSVLEYLKKWEEIKNNLDNLLKIKISL